MLKMNNPHDKFIKDTLTKKENAVSFLKNYLPQEIKDKINPEDIEIEKDSFVNEELKEYFSDLLYKVKIDGKEGYVYLLFEHKSYPDKDIGLQLLEYLLQIWKSKRKQKQMLPAVIPMIIYHGNREWKISTRFSDLINTGHTFSKYIPDFEYILYDLSQMSDEDIIGTDELRARLLLLRYIRRKDFIDKFTQILEQYDINLLKPLVIYVVNVRGDDLEDFHKQIKARSKIGGEVMMTIAEQLEKKGIKKGKKEGKREGKREEQIEIAMNLLDVLSVKEISKRTGLSIKKVKELKKEN